MPTDTERLDWLVARGGLITAYDRVVERRTQRTERVYGLSWTAADGGEYWEDADHAHESARAAIDAAMSREERSDADR